MRLSIKSRKLQSTFNFFMIDGGGYIFLEYQNCEGTYGTQICEKGKMLGNTLRASPDTFKKICTRWYQQYLRREIEYSF